MEYIVVFLTEGLFS